MRAEGLSSLLMGGQAPGNQDNWNLARAFYDLIVFWPPGKADPSSFEEHLTPGGTVVYVDSSDSDVDYENKFSLAEAGENFTVFRLNQQSG